MTSAHGTHGRHLANTDCSLDCIQRGETHTKREINPQYTKSQTVELITLTRARGYRQRD